jgi:hypothetical protein
MKKIDMLDALAWASLSEPATIARLTNLLVRDCSEHSYPTQKTFIEAIRSTSPPRGRAGPMLKLVETEFARQRPIFWKRKHEQDNWAAYLAEIQTRKYRINAAYAGVHQRPVYTGRRNNPLPYSAPYEERQKWENDENKRDKGDECHSIIIHQSCIVSLMASNNESNKPHLKVRYIGSGRTLTTFLRDRVSDFGNLWTTLGGRPVLGALAHGKRVEIDYPGRRFIIHHDDGETHTAPWLAVRYEKTDGGWREDEKPIVVIGRKADESAESTEN